MTKLRVVLAGVAMMATPAQAEPLPTAACNEAVDRQIAHGLLREARDVVDGSLQVVVDQAMWDAMRFRERQAISQSLLCAEMADEPFDRVTFRSDMTNKLVGEMVNGELVIP